MQCPETIVRQLRVIVPSLALVRTDETNDEGRNAALVIFESPDIDRGVVRFQIPRTPQSVHAAESRARDKLALSDEDAATVIALLPELHRAAPFSAWPLTTVEPPRMPLPVALDPSMLALAESLRSMPFLTEIWAVYDSPPMRPGQKAGGDDRRLWVQFLTHSGQTISVQWSMVLATLKGCLQGESQHLATKRWRTWAAAVGATADTFEQLVIRLLPFMMLCAPCRVRLS